MSNATNVRRGYVTLDKQETFDGYSKVVIEVDDDVKYSAGSDLGRTLTLTCPFGTQEMAEDILAKVMGHQYQPFSATAAHLDPAAELGDGITVGLVYGCLCKKNISHGPLYTADISAPGGEKINYQYPWKTLQRRKVERNFRDVSATFKVQAGLISQEVSERKADSEEFRAQFKVQTGLIEAKVSKTGGSASSFGWVLDESSWIIKANSVDILKATKDGLEVYGKITATSGKIGGFDITSNYLTYNNQPWGGTNSTGIYIGPSGIQLGKNFKVDSAGNLSAVSGNFSGTVHAGNIQYGGSSGTLDGAALTSHSVYGSQIGYNTISTSYTNSGINTSLGYADYANNVFSGAVRASYGKFTWVDATGFTFNGSDVRWVTITDASGINYTVLARE